MLVPMQRKRMAVGGMVENWFSMQAVRPSSVHHHQTVASTGSGVNGWRSRLRRFGAGSDVIGFATTLRPSRGRSTVTAITPPPDYDKKNWTKFPSGERILRGRELLKYYDWRETGYARINKIIPDASSMAEIFIDSCNLRTHKKAPSANMNRGQITELD